MEYVASLGKRLYPIDRSLDVEALVPGLAVAGGVLNLERRSGQRPNLDELLAADVGANQCQADARRKRGRCRNMI